MDGLSTISTTTRSDLSLLYRVLRICIRPLRPHLVKPGKPLPAGSPKLNPPKSIPGIKERQSNGLYLYDFRSETSPQIAKFTHSIYYFAGGGFQSPPSSEHWKLCRELSVKLAAVGYSVTLLSYPLAPNSPAPESLPLLRSWLKDVCDAASKSGQNVSLVGDSAGGNVALNLGLWWAGEAVSTGVANPIKQILAISPATDLRNENPGIKDADRLDPVLTVGLTDDVGKKWASSWGVDNPEVNTNLSSNIAALKSANIKVHGIVGTADVLAPDALVFKDLCVKHDVQGEWLIWTNQMHCFPLAWVYGLSEGKAGKEWILDILRRHAM